MVELVYLRHTLEAGSICRRLATVDPTDRCDLAAPLLRDF